ncbi:MAG: hypothetical protein IJ849_09505 [Selenomonadaceae bacterium]|nr:hypothetical protein [Selenomonadaceae bacterium]
MYKYNDYLKLTKDYLRNYPYYKQAVKSITEDITDIRERLALESPKTAKYSTESGGGYSELNGVEQAANKRMWLERRCDELQENRRALQRQTEKVDAAVNALSTEEQKIIQLFYFEGLTHQALAERIHLSERSSRRRVKKATDSIALMLFGLDAQKTFFFIRGV